MTTTKAAKYLAAIIPAAFPLFNNGSPHVTNPRPNPNVFSQRRHNLGVRRGSGQSLTSPTNVSQDPNEQTPPTLNHSPRANSPVPVGSIPDEAALDGYVTDIIDQVKTVLEDEISDTTGQAASGAELPPTEQEDLGKSQSETTNGSLEMSSLEQSSDKSRDQQPASLTSSSENQASDNLKAMAPTPRSSSVRPSRPPPPAPGSAADSKSTADDVLFGFGAGADADNSGSGSELSGILEINADYLSDELDQVAPGINHLLKIGEGKSDDESEGKSEDESEGKSEDESEGKSEDESQDEQMIEVKIVPAATATTTTTDASLPQIEALDPDVSKTNMDLRGSAVSHLVHGLDEYQSADLGARPKQRPSSESPISHLTNLSNTDQSPYTVPGFTVTLKWPENPDPLDQAAVGPTCISAPTLAQANAIYAKSLEPPTEFAVELDDRGTTSMPDSISAFDPPSSSSPAGSKISPYSLESTASCGDCHDNILEDFADGLPISSNESVKSAYNGPLFDEEPQYAGLSSEPHFKTLLTNAAYLLESRFVEQWELPVATGTSSYPQLFFRALNDINYVLAAQLTNAKRIFQSQGRIDNPKNIDLLKSNLSKISEQLQEMILAFPAYPRFEVFPNEKRREELERMSTEQHVAHLAWYTEVKTMQLMVASVDGLFTTIHRFVESVHALRSCGEEERVGDAVLATISKLADVFVKLPEVYCGMGIIAAKGGDDRKAIAVFAPEGDDPSSPIPVNVALDQQGNSVVQFKVARLCAETKKQFVSILSRNVLTLGNNVAREGADFDNGNFDFVANIATDLQTLINETYLTINSEYYPDVDPLSYPEDIRKDPNDSEQDSNAKYRARSEYWTRNIQPLGAEHPGMLYHETHLTAARIPDRWDHRRKELKLDTLRNIQESLLIIQSDLRAYENEEGITRESRMDTNQRGAIDRLLAVVNIFTEAISRIQMQCALAPTPTECQKADSLMKNGRLTNPREPTFEGGKQQNWAVQDSDDSCKRADLDTFTLRRAAQNDVLPLDFGLYQAQNRFPVILRKAELIVQCKRLEDLIEDFQRDFQLYSEQLNQTADVSFDMPSYTETEFPGSSLQDEMQEADTSDPEKELECNLDVVQLEKESQRSVESDGPKQSTDYPSMPKVETVSTVESQGHISPSAQLNDLEEVEVEVVATDSSAPHHILAEVQPDQNRDEPETTPTAGKEETNSHDVETAQGENQPQPDNEAN